jgi:hypothetical protein
MFPFRGDWSSSEYYYGSTTRRDIVKYNNAYYIIKADAGSVHSNTNPASDTTHWESFGTSFSNVATGFLFTEEAVIKDAVIQILRTEDTGSGKITAEGNAMSMFDAYGNVALKISGNDIDTAGTSQTLTVPTSAGSSYNLSDQNANAGYTYNASGTIGTITAASASNTLSIPAIAIRSQIRNGSVTNGYVGIKVFFNITVDGVVAASGESSWLIHNTGSSNVYLDFTTDAASTSVSAGSHTIGYSLVIQAQGSGDYTSSSGINIAAYVNTATTITLSYPNKITEFGPNGMRIQLGNGDMFQAVKNGNNAQLLLMAGNYGLEVTSSALRFRIGGTWYTASTTTISGNTVLKLTT